MFYNAKNVCGEYMLPPKILLTDLLLVLAGGALGSVFRYLVSILAHYETSSPFPYKTFIVNVIGCFLVGYLAMRFQQNGISLNFRLFLITGFIGAFTTYSTFSYETLTLFQQGHYKTGLLNIMATTIAGLLAVSLGFWIGMMHKVG
jgi:CrcB protein